jgi:hypothetical protein
MFAALQLNSEKSKHMCIKTVVYVWYNKDTYIQSRADAMLNIEQTIVELGTIFQQLAHMVKEQEDMVQR